MKRLNKEVKERVMDFVERANSGEYETKWDNNGVPRVKEKKKIKQGKFSRAQGSRFELKVREDLTNQGWIVDKWTNNVDLEKNEIYPAKRKFNPFSRVMSIGTGFPDFITIKKVSNDVYHIHGVEVKMNGLLSKEEKEKCKWYLNKGIFSKIWIAKKGKKRGEIEYDDFMKRYGKNTVDFLNK